MATTLFAGCQNEVRQINSVEDLKTARIGCWPECGYEIKAREVLPDAEYIYLDYLSDLVQNLMQHKIDAFVLGDAYIDELKRQGIPVDYLPQSLGEVPIAYIFTKSERGEKICSQMNEFIAKIKSNGELDALKLKWMESDEEQRILKKSNLSGENGKILIGTDAQSSPFVYLRGEEVVGFEVELIDKFCAAYGYDYEIKVELFETMLADVTLGKLDVGLDAIERMPEREQSMLFSEPTYINEVVAVINSNSAQSENYFNRIKTSLINEERWQMLLKGTGTTLLITVSSIILGTLFGFLVYMIYREKFKYLNKIIDESIKIFQGLPTMVLLLFAYYIIFGNVNVSSTFVAITVFALILSVSVFVMLKSGAESIPKGQMEAALALGFSERRAFIKFILPQIVRIFFPSYKLALNAILLETAIVGYIAVTDLTRTADLIRARTYDAFVPIVAIAIIYLILSRLLMKIADKIAERLDPKNRKREKILSGVKL